VPKYTALTEELYDYLLSVSLREPVILRRLREETAADPMARMQVAPDQGQFMALLVKLMDARYALEVGTFTGYSSLSLALALPREGRLVTLDRSEEWTRVARRYWAEAGVTEKIELRLGDARSSLQDLISEGRMGGFDFAFIDADKANYAFYVESCLELIRPGGLIAIDNVLWDGRVTDPEWHDPDTEAIRALNAKLATDDRIDISILPVADGITLARKRI
jgi:caffeoyl-CoA O-methyltransferase